MFFFLETEAKQRIYKLQQESETQRLLKKKNEMLSTEQSLSTVKSVRKKKSSLCQLNELNHDLN